MDMLNQVKGMFLAQGKNGCFGLWEIIKVIKEDIGINDFMEIKVQVMSVVRSLLEAGLCAGDSPYSTQGEFVPWPSSDLEAVLERIETEWELLGREPNIPDSPWFGYVNC